MSRHPTDRLALAFGLPLLVLGLAGLADDTGLVQPADTWVWITVLVTLGGLGVALSFANLLRDRSALEPESGPVHDATSASGR